MKGKRMISTLVAVLLLMAPIQPNKVNAETSFTDINNSYAKDAIVQLLNQGILDGVSDSKFNPAGKIERKDFAIILAKALHLNIENHPAAPSFRDVPLDNYAYPYVEAVKAAGLIKGIGNGNYGADQGLTRQDMVVLFVRALGIEVAGKGSSLTFSDRSAISEYAKDYIAAALEYGLIIGESNSLFNPTAKADRQSVALVTSKFIKTKDDITPAVTPAPVATLNPTASPTATPTATSVPSTTSPVISTEAPTEAPTPTPNSTSAINLYGFEDQNGYAVSKNFYSGNTDQIRFDLFPSEALVNGTVEVTVEGFTFETSDYYNIGNIENGWIHVSNDQISNNGHTLTISANQNSNSDISFKVTKLIPPAGEYLIKIRVDADGLGTDKAFSKDYVLTLVSH